MCDAPPAAFFVEVGPSPADIDDVADWVDCAGGLQIAGAHLQLPVPNSIAGRQLGAIDDRRAGCGVPEIIRSGGAGPDCKRRDPGQTCRGVCAAGLAAGKRQGCERRRRPEKFHVSPGPEEPSTFRCIGWHPEVARAVSLVPPFHRPPPVGCHTRLQPVFSANVLTVSAHCTVAGAQGGTGRLVHPGRAGGGLVRLTPC